MAQEICKRNKFGYCMHGDLCRLLHVNTVCEKIDCDIFSCRSRHPYSCKYYKEFRRCRFLEYCKYKHEKALDSIEKETKDEPKNMKRKVDDLEKQALNKENVVELENKLL